MRDPKTIEREIFAARQDLEDSLASLSHSVREKVQVRARVLHAIDDSPLALGAAVLLTVGVGALIYAGISRARR